jgi:hypothetical protein
MSKVRNQTCSPGSEFEPGDKQLVSDKYCKPYNCNRKGMMMKYCNAG